jgi:hypothetical protein
MKIEPDIVKELRDQEKLGLLYKRAQQNYEKLQTNEKNKNGIDQNHSFDQRYNTTVNNIFTNGKITEQLELINSINNYANHGASLKEIIKKITEKTSELFSSNGASIYLLSEDKKFLNLKNINITKSQIIKIEKLMVFLLN